MSDYREQAAAAAREAMQGEAPAPPTVEPWDALALRHLPKGKQLQLALLHVAQVQQRTRAHSQGAVKPHETVIGQVSLARIRTGYALESCQDAGVRDMLAVALAALETAEEAMAAQIKRRQQEGAAA